MIRLKHSRRRRWNCRKCYFLLSTLTICLIIFYCIISYKQHLMFLTLIKHNDRHNNGSGNSNKDSSNSHNNSSSYKNGISFSKNMLKSLTKKHVVDSNKQQRDWHINTQKQRLQVTRDHPQTGTTKRSNKHQQPKQQNIIVHQPQDTILSLVTNKFGQMAITKGTYNLKLIENKNTKNNSNNSTNNKYNYNKKSLQLTGFNVELSDSLPLQRLIPDTRHKSCKTKLYPTHLPTCSIIIVYYNELTNIILRTLYTLLHRTPSELLKEILLVNDHSEMENELEQHLKQELLNKVKVIQLPERQGLIRARLRGAKEAKADILVFLDAHVEVNENWLPPLLAPLLESNKTCTTPVIDVIKYDTLEYQSSVPSRGGFNWQFNYVQLPLLKEEESLQPQPHNNPIMNGGIFAISKEYFWLVGGYDEGLEIWGAEQFELSFKIWMCGGRLLEVPCSRVGHLYRDPNFQVKYTNRTDDFISKNYKRVAEVWMDEYKEYLYEHVPKLNKIKAGNLMQQKLLRQKLKCKTFKWFLSNIAPDLLKAYPPVEPNDFALGAIQSLSLPQLCIDLSSTKRRQILRDVLKPCSPDLKYPYNSQKFHLSFRHDLRHQGNCLEVQSWSSHAPIWLWPCHNLGGNQYWFYDRNTQMFVQGKTDAIKRCLEVNRITLQIFVNYCDFSKQAQKWQMGYVNQTAMEHFFEE